VLDEFGGVVTYSAPNLSDEHEIAALVSQGYRQEDAVKMVYDRNIMQLNRINSTGSNHNINFELGHNASMSFYKSQAINRQQAQGHIPPGDGYLMNGSGYAAPLNNHGSMHNMAPLPMNRPHSPAISMVPNYHTSPQPAGLSPAGVISPAAARVPVPMIPHLPLGGMQSGTTPPLSARGGAGMSATPRRPSKTSPLPATPPLQATPRMMQQVDNSSPTPMLGPGAAASQQQQQHFTPPAAEPAPRQVMCEAEIEAMRLAIQESLADLNEDRDEEEEEERLEIDRANEEALQQALQASLEEMKNSPMVSITK
jgi:hypothetical protein